MEEPELEEGEACSYDDNNNHYGSIDPDRDLSYIDEKIQNVLGHFQKDFEGGVSAENLGAKFGGYGSFLPTYQRSPVLSCPKTPSKAHNSNNSPYNLHREHGYTASSSVLRTMRAGPSSSGVTSLSAPKALSSNNSAKQETPVRSNHMETSTSRQNSLKKKSSVLNKQNSLKFRLKVGPENLTAENNTAIYSGLGLDGSLSSSLDVSTSESEDVYCEARDILLESPSKILMAITADPLDGEPLLSPLADDFVFFSKKKRVSEKNNFVPVSKMFPESSHIMVNSSDSRLGDEKSALDKKMKSVDRNNGSVQTESFSRKSHLDEIGSAARAKLGADTLFPFGSDKEKSVVGVPDVSEPFNVMLVSNDVEKGLSDKVFYKERVSNEGARTSSAGSSEEDTKEARKYGKYKGGKISDSDRRSSTVSKGTKSQEVELKDSLRKDRQENIKLLPQRFGGIKETKEIQNSTVPETKKKPITEVRSQTVCKKVEEAYKEVFGDMGESEEEDAKDQNRSFEVEGFGNSKKTTCATNDVSERSLNSKKAVRTLSSRAHPEAVMHDAPPSSNKPVSEAVHANPDPVVIQENWVGCDKCEKWRLLPLGILPKDLPEKWICTMLDWLPGMDNCNVPESETTNAIQAMHQVPTLEGQGIMQSNPVGAISQTNPEDDIRKKRKKGIKEISCETVNEDITRRVSTSDRSIGDPEFVIRTGKSGDLTIKRHKDKQKEIESVGQHSDLGNAKSLKMKKKRDADREQEFILSKKMKMENFLFSDEDQVSEHAGASRPSSSSGVPVTSAGRDHPRYNDHPMETHSGKKLWPQTSAQKSKDVGSVDVGNNDDSCIKRKRKLNDEGHETQGLKEKLIENDHQKQKKARVLKNEGKESSSGKNYPILEKKSIGSSKTHNSAAATSSSSKVSDSRRMKASFREAKGSPVESVSSSPIRVLDPEKVVASARIKKEESRRTNFCTTANLRRSLDGENDGRRDRLGTDKKDEAGLSFQDSHSDKAKEEFQPSINSRNHSLLNAKANHVLSRKDQTHDEGRQNSDHQHNDGSCPRKSGKSSSRSKYRSRKKIESEDDAGNAQKKSIGKLSSENSKPQSLLNLGRHDSTNKTPGNSMKPNIPGDKAEPVSEREICRPPTRGLQDELLAQSSLPASKLNKPDNSCKLANDSSQVDASKALIQMPENNNLDQSLQIGQSPSPLRPEPAQAASNALREAKDLKHMADRLKKSSSTLENIGYYFEACLKFLHGASILESCGSENAKHGEMVQSMGIYSSTAKLLCFCAHEYEKLKDMAAAALAYKCMEVACMRVVYSSHASANRYRHELQTSLQMAPSGESPSSSASDVDNLNQPAIADKVGTSKCMNSPQIAGNHVITAQNRHNLLRLLQFAQEVNGSMDASRKSRIALATARHVQDLSSLQRALDYNFQDVQGLLHLVRLAMKAINL